MIYTIRGRHKNAIAVDEYVQWLCYHLNIGHLKKPEVHIKFLTACEGDVLGLCYEDLNIEIAKTQNGKELTFFEQMLTLSHEMVHAKQFIRGQYPSEREAKKLEFGLYGKCFPWHLVK